MSYHCWFSGDPTRAIQVGERALASALDDFPSQVLANDRLGMAYYALGDYRRAMDFCEWTVASLPAELIRERLGLATLPSVLSRSYLVGCLAELGAFAEGVASGEEGVRIAEAAGHPFSLTLADWAVGGLYLRQGDLPKAIAVLERGLGVCQTAHIPHMFPRIASLLGYARVLSGGIAAELPLLEQAVERDASMHMMAFHSLYLAQLSEAYLLAGRPEDAIRPAERALELARAHQQRGREAWTLRLLGELASHRDPPEVDLAEAFYRQALALAEELGMRPLVAHCHLGLGTLYRRADRLEQAHAELSAAVELFRTMEITFWLTRAEAALNRTA